MFCFGLSAQVHVKGYYRKDGTYVKSHYRSGPNNTINDNYSTKGNINPYTGKKGWIERESSSFLKNNQNEETQIEQLELLERYLSDSSFSYQLLNELDEISIQTKLNYCFENEYFYEHAKLTIALAEDSLTVKNNLIGLGLIRPDIVFGIPIEEDSLYDFITTQKWGYQSHFEYDWIYGKETVILYSTDYSYSELLFYRTSIVFNDRQEAYKDSTEVPDGAVEMMPVGLVMYPSLRSAKSNKKVFKESYKACVAQFDVPQSTKSVYRSEVIKYAAWYGYNYVCELFLEKDEVRIEFRKMTPELFFRLNK